MSWLAWDLATAGLGNYIWHWGIGFGLIICLVGAAELLTTIPFVGAMTSEIRRDLLWCAVAVALVLGGEWYGARDATARCEAKAAVIVNVVHKATIDANGNPTKDKFNEGFK